LNPFEISLVEDSIYFHIGSELIHSELSFSEVDSVRLFFAGNRDTVNHAIGRIKVSGE